MLLNGRPLAVKARPATYVRIERAWAAGDTLALTMPMHAGFTTWPRTGAVTVDRGPLSYSVQIGERWSRCGGTEEWPEWEVLPTTPWNYGVDGLKILGLEEKPVSSDQPWKPENAPVRITVAARKIPGWQLENQTVAELQVSPIRSEEPRETITLIPLGCARLRIACLPVIGSGRDARPWVPGSSKARRGGL